MIEDAVADRTRRPRTALGVTDASLGVSGHNLDLFEDRGAWLGGDAEELNPETLGLGVKDAPEFFDGIDVALADPPASRPSR